MSKIQSIQELKGDYCSDSAVSKNALLYISCAAAETAMDAADEVAVLAKALAAEEKAAAAVAQLSPAQIVARGRLHDN